MSGFLESAILSARLWGPECPRCFYQMERAVALIVPTTGEWVCPECNAFTGIYLANYGNGFVKKRKPRTS